MSYQVNPYDPVHLQNHMTSHIHSISSQMKVTLFLSHWVTGWCQSSWWHVEKWHVPEDGHSVVQTVRPTQPTYKMRAMIRLLMRLLMRVIMRRSIYPPPPWYASSSQQKIPRIRANLSECVSDSLYLLPGAISLTSNWYQGYYQPQEHKKRPLPHFPLCRLPGPHPK